MSPASKILFIVAEASPLVKVGGLGDVAGSLPPALRRIGHDARVVLPGYSFISARRNPPLMKYTVPFMHGPEEVEIFETALKEQTPVYLISNRRYFDRPSVYGEADDLERFLLFSLAAVELPRHLGWQPDIFHCHDWHTGMVPALLKTDYREDVFYASCASVFTIHNLAYQGWFDDSFARHAGLHRCLPAPDNPLRGRCYNMAGIGIYHSDMLSTVSETYSREILTPEYGMGLESLLHARRDRLVGILNGVDYEDFNPAADPCIAANYDMDNIGAKVDNKLSLQRRTGLEVNPDIPLIGAAGRVVDQKGIDIMVEALDHLLVNTNIQFVLQGAGESRYEDLLRQLEARYPDKVRLFLTIDLVLSRSVFAGSDIFLMPSRFEPCGLTPLIALRYGSIPIVRRTGGLGETIADCMPDLKNGTGFVFEKYSAGELLTALKQAIAAFQDPVGWKKLMLRAMKTNFSWQPALPKYEALYSMAQNKSRERSS